MAENRLSVIFVLVMIVGLFAPDITMAKDPKLEAREAATELLQNVQIYVAECSKKAQPLKNTGRTSGMLRGAAAESECLVSILDQLAQSFYSKGAFGDGGIRSALGRLHKAMHTIEETVMTDHLACGGFCGTIQPVIAAGRWTSYLHSLIETMAGRLKKPL